MPRARTTSRLLAALALCSAGCAVLRPSEPRLEPVLVRVAAAARLNPDEQGASLPTAVRIYQLAGAARFQALELTELLGDPKALLGEDLLGVEELLLQPGGQAERTFVRAKGTRALGVVAIVRRPAGGAWRQVVDVPDRRLELGFEVEEYRIQRR